MQEVFINGKLLSLKSIEKLFLCTCKFFEYNNRHVKIRNVNKAV